MGEAVNWGDQRNALRQRTLKRGHALVNDIEVAEVTVRNMSLTGARLSSPDCDNLPDRFTLRMGDEGLTREVEVRSRAEGGLGVRFVKPLSTREFGAEFLQPRSPGARKRTVAEQRADLVRRAREGLERLDLGFVAPPIAMPDPEPGQEADPDADGGPADGDGTIDGPRAGEERASTDHVEPQADGGETDPAAGPAQPAVTDPAVDDGLGEGSLGRGEPRCPPRAVRLRTPWFLAIAAHR